MTEDQRISDYARRLSWSLQRLESGERTSLVQEIRAHLIESAGSGTRALDRALAGLGTPYALGRRFMEEYELSGAVAGSGPQHLLLALLGRSTRRMAATAVMFAAVLCYLLTAIFVVMAVAKPFAPGNIGLWRFGEGWGGGILLPPPGAPELLGWWIIPLTLILAIVSYMLGTMV